MKFSFFDICLNLVGFYLSAHLVLALGDRPAAQALFVLSGLLQAAWLSEAVRQNMR